MHRLLSLNVILATGFLLSYCCGLRAEGGYKAGTYSFYVTSSNQEGDEQFSVDYHLAMSEDNEELEPLSDSESDPESRTESGQEEPRPKSSTSSENGKRFRISVTVSDAAKVETVSPAASGQQNQASGQNQANSVSTFLVLADATYTIAQDEYNFAAVDNLPLALMEYGDPVYGNAISGIPLEQVLQPPTNPLQNPLSLLSAGSTIMASLPVIQHLPTGITIYPVFTYSGQVQPVSPEQGLTLLATAHQCVNCTCVDCTNVNSSAPCYQLAPDRYCAGCHCCLGEPDENGQSPEEADEPGRFSPSEAILCNGPVFFPEMPESGAGISPADGLLMFHFDGSSGPESVDFNLPNSPVQGVSASPCFSLPSPLSPESSLSSCPAHFSVAVQITLTPDNSAIEIVSYHFQNGDTIVIHIPPLTPTVLSESPPDSSDRPLSSSGEHNSLTLVTRNLVASVLFSALEKYNTQNKRQ